MCDQFEETAVDLNCVDELKEMKRFTTEQNWAQRQLDQVNSSGDSAEMVKWMVEQSRISV